MTEKEYEDKLSSYLLEAATRAGLLEGSLLDSPDIDGRWTVFAPSYFGDCVKEFNAYPEYVLACAGYLGMAVATLWDEDWTRHADTPYEFFQSERGFDDMDDYINANILKDNKFSVKAMELCSHSAYHFLMEQRLEPGSTIAYRCFLRTVSLMYRIGAAVQLRHLGYRFQKANLT